MPGLKQPVLIRAKVLREVAQLFRNTRSFISCLPELEGEALDALGGDAWLDNATDVTNLILERMGHELAPTEQRFDKVRRELAKIQPDKALKGSKLKP